MHHLAFRLPLGFALRRDGLLVLLLHALTMMPMKRFSTQNVVMTMNGMKKSSA